MRKKDTFLLVLGILVGLALEGPASAAVRQLTATPSTQSFYVNGVRTQFEAYAIGGSNYIKLRDIGKAVDFGVTYDEATNIVYINTSAHYQQEVTQPAQTASSPSPVLTEESVKATLDALKVRYPHGTTYSTPYLSTSNGPYHSGMNCAGWATLCSDAAFGNLPWRRVDRPAWNQIRVGDLVEYRNSKSYHVMVVTGKTDEYITTTDSDNLQKVYWGGQIFKWWLEQQPQYVLYSRYP